MLGIRNVKIKTITQGTIPQGNILIKSGKIVALGEAVDLSNCAKVIDGTGKVATPGLIDPHTHLGLSESGVGWEGRDTNEGTDPITPQLSAYDGINMCDQAFQNFREAGITTVGVLPGSGNIIGGTGLALKCKGKIVDGAVVKDPVGMKVALGENPKTSYGGKKKSPATRMGNAALLREALTKAKDYLAKLENPDENDSSFKRNQVSEALLPVIKG